MEKNSNYIYKRIKRYNRYYTVVYCNGKFFKFCKYTPETTVKKIEVEHKKILTKIKLIEKEVEVETLKRQAKHFKQVVKTRGKEAPEGFLWYMVIRVNYRDIDGETKEYMTIASSNKKDLPKIMMETLFAYNSRGGILDKNMVSILDEGVISVKDFMVSRTVEPKGHRGELIVKHKPAEYIEPEFKKELIKEGLIKKSKKRKRTNKKISC